MTANWFDRSVRRATIFLAVAAALGNACASAGLLPGGDGKLDFGTDGLNIPALEYRNATSPRTVTLLAEQLKREKTVFRRVQLVRDLGECRLAGTIEPLVAAMADPSPEVRATAAMMLGNLADTTPIFPDTQKAVLAAAWVRDGLERLLSDPDPSVRAAALRALGAIAGPTCPAIVTALGKLDDAPSHLAALELASTVQHAQLIAATLKTMPAERQARAIYAFGRCKDVAQVKLLCDLAGSAELSCRVAACQALGQIGSSDAVPTLATLCADAHPTIRREATRAFAACQKDIGRRQTHGLKLLGDGDASVRQAAVDLLGANLSPQCVRLIAAQLRTEYRPLFIAARTALIAAKDPVARQACIELAGELLDAPDPRRQEDGSFLLGYYRSDYRLERHIALATPDGKKADWGLVAQACQSLGQIGRPEARPAVLNLATLKDGGEVVVQALIAAGRLGMRDVFPVCVGYMNADPENTDPRLRQASAFAVGAAGDAKSPGVKELFRLIKSAQDGLQVKFEAVKALGNLKLAGEEQRFPADSNFGPEYKWIVQWATARLTGHSEPWTPAVSPWIAQTSVTDIASQPR